MTERIRIAMLAFMADAERGGQINLLRLLSGLDPERFACSVIVPSEGTLAEVARAHGAPVRVARVSSPRRAWHRWPAGGWSIVRLRWVLRALRPHVLYVDGPEHVWPAWAAARGLGIRIVWHVQTSFETRYQADNVRVADHIVGCADRVAARFRSLGARPSCIPNAVDTDRFSPGGSDPVAGFEPGEQGLLYVGAFTWEKGLPDLILAMSFLAESHPAARLWIAGKTDSPRAKALAAFAQAYGLAGRIRWLGYRSDVPALLRAARAFVLPSYFEGLSLALLEAMAAGCPVVCTDIPGNLEVANPETARLVTVGNPRALAAQLGALLDDEDGTTRRAEAARQRILDRHRLVQYVAAFEQLFVRLSASGPALEVTS